MYLSVTIDSLIDSFQKAQAYAEANNQGNEAATLMKIIRDLEPLRNLPPEAFAGMVPPPAPVPLPPDEPAPADYQLPPTQRADDPKMPAPRPKTKLPAPIDADAPSSVNTDFDPYVG